MINLYKRRNTATHQLQLPFVNEEASADGVTRDVFLAFSASLYSNMDGSSECVPHTIADNDDLVVACRKSYYTCNYKSSIKRCIFGGDINKTELLTLLMAFIMPKETSIIQYFWSGLLNKVEDAIMDILT